tara:strand:+ start:328 stop:759 length:432 start_codon:yes stop_codon:yes gene_type:complete
MRTKHTEDFWKQVEEQKEFNKQLSFIQELSEKQHSSVISNCLKEKCNFSHSVTTAQMFEYCMKNKIIPLGNDRFNNRDKNKDKLSNQSKIDFDKPLIIFSKLLEGEDITIEDEDGWVLVNDSETKLVTIEFENGDMKNFEYEK